MTYDWRLAVPLLEQRDGYFTKLKAAIEGAHKLHKEKVRSVHLQCLADVQDIDIFSMACGSARSVILNFGS